MNRVKLAVLLAALIATSFQSLESATTACPAKCLSMVYDMIPACSAPAPMTVIAEHCGLDMATTQACLRTFGTGSSSGVVRLPDGTYCRQTG